MLRTNDASAVASPRVFVGRRPLPTRASLHHRLETLEDRLLLATVSVDTVAELVAAVNNGAANDTVLVAAGTYDLSASLAPKAGMIIQGAGAGQTILRPVSTWLPSTSNLPDNGTSATSCTPSAYLFNLGGNDGIKISGMTLDANAQLHGAIFGNNADNLEFFNLSIEDCLWSGIRTFLMGNSNIHDNAFIDAGGRWNAGSPGTTGGTTGGGIYVTYMGTSDIGNNRFTRTLTSPERNYYGIKGREGRNSRIHDNTIMVNFSIEFPHENDYYMEIDHNYLKGTVSIPKYAGGTVPTGGYTFHLHHNYFLKSYALELARNGSEFDHNLFDFSTTDDGGNLISSFGSEAAPGPVSFHDNLVKNPGRGVFWAQGVINNLSFRNNHIIANTTTTPRTEGLFGFNTGTDFTTVTIKDNIIECVGQTRPLVRNSASYSAVIENNTLTNISDTANYANPNTGATRGPTETLNFTVGVDGEYTVNQWTIALTGNLGMFANAQDIGAVAATGSTSESGGVYTVKGSGADVWGSADEFHFAYKDYTGDGVFIAKVDSVQNTNSYAKAGVMFRDGTAANARNAYVSITPGNGVRFQVRTSTGGTTTSQSVTGITAPRWVKLVRSGNSFTAFYSSDGTSWTQVGTAKTVTMASTAKAGLAVTSHADGTLCTASISNVSLGLPVTTVVPGHDATVRGGTYASTNYGGDATLQVKEDSNSSYDRWSYLKFDLSAFSASVTSANLVLPVISSGTDMANLSIEVRLVTTDTWDESTLTWNNKPATSTVLATIAGSSLSVGGTATVNLLSAINDTIAGDKTLSIALVAVNAGASERYVNFGSSEQTDANLRSRLVIQ